MKSLELSSCFIKNSEWRVASRKWLWILFFTTLYSLLSTLCLSEEEGVISLDNTEVTPKQQLKIAQTKQSQKEISNLYKSAERYRRKKKLLSAVEKYKEVLYKDPYHKKSRERLSDIYTKLKYKLDEKILYKSEDVYYAQSILYFINNDLTFAMNEWGKCLAITPMNEEVRQFFNKTKEQLAEEYQRKKQEAKESKIKKLLEDAVELFNSAKYDKAAEKFQGVLNLNPGHVSATFYLEQIEDIKNADAGKKPSHKKKLSSTKEKETISIDYEKAEDFYNQGLKEYMAGHLNEAIDIWKKCLRYNPTHEKAQINIEKAKSSLRKE